MRTAILVAAVALVCCVAPAQTPTAQPLEKMQRFQLKEFPIAAWCVHDWGASDYTEQYARRLKDAGFNLMIDTIMMVEAAEKGGMKLIVNLQLDDKFSEETHKTRGAKHNIVKKVSFPDAPGLKKIHAKIGKSTALAGYFMAEGTVGWLAKEAPGLVPVVGGGADAVMIVAASGMGGRNKDFELTKQQKLLGALEGGRRRANETGLAMWPQFPAIGLWKFGNSQGASQTRFQVFASLAYGAQGLTYNDYTGWRPEWQPGAVTFLAAQKANRYVARIAPHVLGTRSIGVYHGKPTGEDAVPDGSLPPGPGKLIEKLSDGVLAGVLVREQDFKANKLVPACVVVADKRTGPGGHPNDKGPAREVTVSFGPEVKSLEVIADEGDGPVKSDGRTVTLKLLPGDGRLVKVTAGEK